MRGDRNDDFFRPPNGSRRRHRRNGYAEEPPDVQKWVRRAETLWSEASSSERSAFGVAALCVVAIVGVAINVLFHVSLALAFVIIPLLFAPILMTILASVSLFAMLSFATAGAGIFFIGTPIMAFAFLAKVMFPFAVLAGGAAYVANKLLRGDREGKEEPVEDVWPEPEDEFEQFDEKLRTGGVYSQRSKDATLWGLSDVVDELDFKGLGEYRQLFIEERIDGRTLLTLTDEDIKIEFGSSMPLGDRMRLSQLVSYLRRRSARLP